MNKSKKNLSQKIKKSKKYLIDNLLFNISVIKLENCLQKYIHLI